MNVCGLDHESGPEKCSRTSRACQGTSEMFQRGLEPLKETERK
jgi:hypothetical protein